MRIDVPKEGIGIDVPGLKIGGSGGGTEYNFSRLFMFDLDSIDNKSLIIVGIVFLVAKFSLLHFNNMLSFY